MGQRGPKLPGLGGEGDQPGRLGESLGAQPEKNVEIPTSDRIKAEVEHNFEKKKH